MKIPICPSTFAYFKNGFFQSEKINIKCDFIISFRPKGSRRSVKNLLTFYRILFLSLFCLFNFSRFLFYWKAKVKEIKVGENSLSLFLFGEFSISHRFYEYIRFSSLSFICLILNYCKIMYCRFHGKCRSFDDAMLLRGFSTMRLQFNLLQCRQRFNNDKSEYLGPPKFSYSDSFL